MAKKKQRTYQQDMVGDSINSIQKVVKPQEEGGSRAVKYLLIGLSVLFLFVMLALPLAVVAANAWREGWEANCHLESILVQVLVHREAPRKSVGINCALIAKRHFTCQG